MFPKTLPPQDFRRLSDVLRAGTAFPLWQAGTILAHLLAASGNCPWPLNPEDILLGPGSQVSIQPSENRRSDAVYRAPECRLSMTGDLQPPAQVYGLCALLYHMLTGAPPIAEEPLAGRRAKLREAVWRMALPGEAGNTLQKILDRGLRLEPTRRQQTVEALKQELEGLAAYLNTEALQVLQISGISGVYAGQQLPLRFPMTLGRQPGACQILFPPDTPGVSRRHCRVELSWGTLLVTDLNSSYGTHLDGEKLIPFELMEWKKTQMLCLGSEQQTLIFL